MDSSTTIFVSEYSIYPALLGFMLAIAIMLVGIIVGISRRRKIEAYGIPAIGLILAVGEPLPIEDFIDNMEVHLTPEGLIPAELAEKDADR